jgi:PAS domain S-box-containing protein
MMTKPTPQYQSKILIIDDDPAIRKLMANALEDEGYELLFAGNGQEGLEKALLTPPDLIFLDVHMPVLDGIGFLKALNQREPGACPVLVISGHEEELLLNECFGQGIFSFIHKPFNVKEIIAVSRRFTRAAEIRNRLSCNLEAATSVTQQASLLGLGSQDGQRLIEALPFPVFVKNREGKVMQVNKALEDFTGFGRDVMLGKTGEEVSRDKQFITNNHAVELTLLENGSSVCHEQMVTDSQGKQQEVVVCRSAVSTDDGPTAAILGIMIDLSEFGFSSFKRMLATRYPDLSTRECEVANLVRLGMSNKEMARQLNIALCTVEYHRANVREKLGLKKGDCANLSTVLLSLK